MFTFTAAQVAERFLEVFSAPASPMKLDNMMQCFAPDVTVNKLQGGGRMFFLLFLWLLQLLLLFFFCF